MWICISFIVGLCLGIYSVRQVFGHQYGILCPLRQHWQLVEWAQKRYPNIVPSWFQKQNKTYLISLWYTRPNLDWPLKKYKKET